MKSQIKNKENRSIIFWITNTNIKQIAINSYSTALKCGSFSKKTSKESTCAVMIRIIVSFAHQIFL